MNSDTLIKPETGRYVVSISKQELAQLPSAVYQGKVVLIDSDQDAAKAADILAAEEIIGFDTETKPSFKRSQSNQVALLQLSTHTHCFLVRLNHIGLHPDLRRILEDPHRLKVGVSVHDDFHHLAKAFNLHPQGFIDLQAFVKDYKIIDNSLSRIYGILFGHRISKGQRLTNWEAHELTIHQQEYAALDAYACIRIYEYLVKNGFTPEQSIYYHFVPQEEHDANGKLQG